MLPVHGPPSLRQNDTVKDLGGDSCSHHDWEEEREGSILGGWGHLPGPSLSDSPSSRTLSCWTLWGEGIILPPRPTHLPKPSIWVYQGLRDTIILYQNRSCSRRKDGNIFHSWPLPTASTQCSLKHEAFANRPANVHFHVSIAWPQCVWALHIGWVLWFFVLY